MDLCYIIPSAGVLIHSSPSIYFEPNAQILFHKHFQVEWEDFFPNALWYFLLVDGTFWMPHLSRCEGTLRWNGMQLRLKTSRKNVKFIATFSDWFLSSFQVISPLDNTLRIAIDFHSGNFIGFVIAPKKRNKNRWSLLRFEFELPKLYEVIRRLMRRF